MINLIKKDNLNLGILETDFDIFSDIVSTFSSAQVKKDCQEALDDYIIPEYFKNKITIAIQTNKMLIGYASFEFKNSNNVSQVEITKLFVLDEFKNKSMETLLIESIIYVSAEVGSRNVIVTVDEHNVEDLNMYKSIGFYELGMNEDGNLLSISVSTAVSNRKLNDKFRDILPDSVDYKDLKLIKKIAGDKSGNIYLTQDGQILKMFTSTSFTYIKDREETLKFIKNIDDEEIVKPKHLVYYDGIFVGYIMEYLPVGEPLWPKCKNYSFEEKLDKIKVIEKAIRNLHKKHIYICNLDPNNIFFDKDDNVKLIGCDSFVIKDNVINTEVDLKYRDPLNRIICIKSDLYAFAITSLQILIDEKIDNNLTSSDIEKIYNSKKKKLPVSFQNYYDRLFKSKDRYYITDAYEIYLDEMYSPNIIMEDKKSGKISIIILSLMMLVVAILGYLFFKFYR